jgi:hypothetical protein
MCTAHVLMRFYHLIDRSFVCKAKEGRHIRNINLFLGEYLEDTVWIPFDSDNK